MRDLLRAVLMTGGGSAASLAFNMTAAKVVALTLGPGGVGLFSILRQAWQAASTIGVLNGQPAVIQGVAARDDGGRGPYLATVFRIVAAVGATVAALLLFLGPGVARWILGREDAAAGHLFRWLALPILLSIGSSCLVGVLIGYRFAGQAALVQVCSMATMALVAYPACRLVLAGNPAGYVVLLTASSLAGLGAALLFLARSGRLRILVAGLRCRFDRRSARDFLAMTATLLITGLVGAVVPLILRALVAARFGLNVAGLLEVSWTVSMAYVTIILGSFSAYYLPALAGTTAPAARAELIRRVFGLAILVMSPLVTALVALKPLVVGLLYSGDFLATLETMRWMLIGDYFKVSSWVFSYTMIADKDKGTLLWTELLWGTATVGGGVFAVHGMQSIEGIGIAFMLLYAAYFLYTVYYVYRKCGFTLDRGTLGLWLIGLGLLAGVSVHTWREDRPDWMKASLWIIGALALSGLGFRFLIRGIVAPPRGMPSRSDSSPVPPTPVPPLE